jgi:hypothetical protein
MRGSLGFLNLFWRKGKAKERWRVRAMLVDPHKTRITLGLTKKTKRLPPWVYRRFVKSPKA